MNINVLLVDDEPVILNGLKTAFDWSALGISTVFTATDGEQALEISRRYALNLIITDIMMPHMDGLEYIRQFRQTNRSARIVILSGYERFEYAQRAMSMGVSQYLLKPVTNDALEHAVRLALQSNPSLPQTPEWTYSYSSPEAAIQAIFHGKETPSNCSDLLPSVFFAAIVKPGAQMSAGQWRDFLLRASGSIFLDNRVHLFEADDQRALLICTLTTQQQRVNQAEKLYAELNLLPELSAGDSIALLVSLPGTTAQDLFAMRGQLNNLDCIRTRQHGVEYVQNSPDLLAMRREIQRAVEYIRYNYDQPLTLDLVSTFVYLSPHYFSKTFKAELGENFSSFLARTRIEQAAQLFQRGRKCVYQVSEMVGYHDVVYFSRLFRKYMGTMPQDYIRQRLNQGE
ncbi:MAG: response regulator [Clostridia bacterium]